MRFQIIDFSLLNSASACIFAIQSEERKKIVFSNFNFSRNFASDIISSNTNFRNYYIFKDIRFNQLSRYYVCSLFYLNCLSNTSPIIIYFAHVSRKSYTVRVCLNREFILFFLDYQEILAFASKISNCSEILCCNI